MTSGDKRSQLQFLVYQIAADNLHPKMHLVPKLIYHSPSVASGAESVFDRTVMGMVEGKSPLIACPYLSIAYLLRIADVANSDWKLLTDVQELLRSQDEPSRSGFRSFFSRHRDAVRHIAGLHAKVIVAGERAFLGSANLTISGMTRKTEMSVVLSEQSEVAEIRAWFEALWHKATEIDLKELNLLLRSLPVKPPHQESLFSFGNSSCSVRTTLMPVARRHSGRWSESAFVGRVAERRPDLVDVQIELLHRLKGMDAVRFHGDGAKVATYHVACPGSKGEVAWVYEDGTVYIRWSKLVTFGDEVVRSYQRLWGDWISTERADGTEKNDGCNLRVKLNPEAVSLIVTNIERLREILESRK